MDNVFGNIIYRDDLHGRLLHAFEELDQILVDHSGPFATNAVIGSKWRQMNDIDEFTKDGIKILRHLIVSEDAAARFATRMARFIGIAVDARCHDGTTTSMLLFCRLAILAIGEMRSELLDRDRYIWSKAFESVLTQCLDYLETIKITEEELFERCQELGIETTIEDVRAAIAYHMAMISSKGDDNLSQKISEIIRSSPRKIYGMFNDTPLAVETKEPYILKKQEYDLSVRANLGNIQDYNHRNDTQYLSEEAVIFATGNDIVTSSMESLFLMAFISTNPRMRGNLDEFGTKEGWEAFHEGKRNLIILTPMLNDPNLVTEINIFNRNNPNTKISWFNTQVNGRMRTSLNKTIHYMAGVPLFQDIKEDEDSTLSLVGLKGPKVRVQFIGTTLSINNLYEKDGGVFHPLYRDPEAFEPYTRFARETEELIEFARENLTNPALDQDEVTYLTSLYRSLTSQDIYDIEIGGSAHDQHANRTVYEDAIGAALSAINEGVILGGYGHLAKHIRAPKLEDGCVYDSGDPAILLNEFRDAFTSIIKDSLRVAHEDGCIRNLIEGGLEDKWSYIVADISTYDHRTDGNTYIHGATLDKEGLETFLKRSPDRTILFQAYGGYNEQFKRCKDILPRLANTTHLADMRIQDGTDVR